MKILGYSERGAVNALLFEIHYRQDGAHLLAELLSLVRFPFAEERPAFAVHEATVLVEQSLSDFGDADAVVMLEDGRTVFVEAKVKAAQHDEWRLREEFARFTSGLADKLDSSNLFTQLYHKMRFADCLRDGSLRKVGAVLFPSCSSKERRSIGKNPVVARAVDEIEKHLRQAFFIGLVPASPEDVETFCEVLPAAKVEEKLFGWGLKGVGFLCWQDVALFCARNNLSNTVAVLNFNEEQIFAPAAGPAEV